MEIFYVAEMIFLIRHKYYNYRMINLVSINICAVSNIKRTVISLVTWIKMGGGGELSIAHPGTIGILWPRT